MCWKTRFKKCVENRGQQRDGTEIPVDGIPGLKIDLKIKGLQIPMVKKLYEETWGFKNPWIIKNRPEYDLYFVWASQLWNRCLKFDLDLVIINVLENLVELEALIKATWKTLTWQAQVKNGDNVKSVQSRRRNSLLKLNLFFLSPAAWCKSCQNVWQQIIHILRSLNRSLLNVFSSQTGKIINIKIMKMILQFRKIWSKPRKNSHWLPSRDACGGMSILLENFKFFWWFL